MIKQSGLITYKGGSQQNEEEQKMRKFIRKFDQGIKIILSDGGWDTHCMDYIIVNIVSWAVRGLWLDRNQEPFLISKIIHVNFYALQSLVLYENYIQSVENLCRLSAPSLTGLSLISNYIVEGSSLRRLNCPFLNILQLGTNKICEMQWCGEMDANLNNLSIEYEGDINRCISFCWIGKLQTRNLETINLKGLKIMKNRKVKRVLNRKYGQNLFLDQ